MAFEQEGFTVVRGPDVLWGGDIRRFHPPSSRACRAQLERDTGSYVGQRVRPIDLGMSVTQRYEITLNCDAPGCAQYFIALRDATEINRVWTVRQQAHEQGWSVRYRTRVPYDYCPEHDQFHA
jgi:hypothetical protein